MTKADLEKVPIGWYIHNFVSGEEFMVIEGRRIIKTCCTKNHVYNDPPISFDDLYIIENERRFAPGMLPKGKNQELQIAQIEFSKEYNEELRKLEKLLEKSPWEILRESYEIKREKESESD
jgi:hypothetical protein